MKNYHLTLTILALLISGLFTACDKDDDDMPQIVEFSDQLLEAQVKTNLGLTTSEDVTTENILDLDTLNISGTDIANLVGLEAAENLIFLHLGETQVTDLDPIKDLRKIQYLRFNDTGITDISDLSGYTSLIYFNANTVTGLTDISPLGGNVGLKEAILRSVPFGNAGMSTIAKFTTIYRLNMRDTEVTDISVLPILMEGGALQNDTPGANGEAVLDLRGLGVDCSIFEEYRDNIFELEGC